MRKYSLLDSFNFALEGIIHTFKTERNFKIHIFFVGLVFILANVCHVSNVEFLIIVLTCALVLICEIINTAIEAIIDLICEERYEYLAKIAKDTAAGGVLIAAIFSVVIGYIIFTDKLLVLIEESNFKIYLVPEALIFLSLAIVVIVTIIIKVKRGKKHKLLSGGMPSGHSALSFAMATLIGLINDGNLFITILGFLLAALVAQSRYEGKIHSALEILLGGVLGTMIILLGFVVFV